MVLNLALKSVADGEVNHLLCYFHSERTIKECMNVVVMALNAHIHSSKTVFII